MELFNGGVKDAIAEAKAKKTVFVVIVTGLTIFESHLKSIDTRINLQDPQVMRARLSLTRS